MTTSHQLPHLGRRLLLRGKPALVLALGLILSACARVNDTGLRLVSTPRDAILLINGQALRGQVMLVPDRTGRVSFVAEPPAPTNPISACHGNLRYTATNAGVMDVRCSDGTQASLQFSLITETRGFAYGSTDAGTVSLTFGLPDEEAMAYLRPPAGKKVVINPKDESLTLE